MDVLWPAEPAAADDGPCKRLVPVVELGRDLFQGEDGLIGSNLPKHRLCLPALRAQGGAG